MPLPIVAAGIAYKKAKTIGKIASNIKNADNNSSTIMGVFIISMCVIFIILSFIYIFSYNDNEVDDKKTIDNTYDISKVADLSDVSDERNRNEGYRHIFHRRNRFLLRLLG
jgi:heme/copper-type cytochrome/quinol oxidase subunit 3